MKRTERTQVQRKHGDEQSSSRKYQTMESRTMGPLLSLVEIPNGNLILIPTVEGIEAAKELLENRSDPHSGGILGNLADMLDHAMGNGWSYIQPEEIGALTDATIISRDCDRDNSGDLIHVGRVYAHMSYAVEDPIEIWASGSDVHFQGA